MDYKVEEYEHENGSCPFRLWLERTDTVTRARIQARILRFETGNLGDMRSLGDGVHEARFDFGPGYRLYFGLKQRSLVILLTGGDKSTQDRDIARAKSYWDDYRSRGEK